jgi:SAM-dependent methyltransferase
MGTGVLRLRDRILPVIYDRLTEPLERRHFAAMRRRVLEPAHGRVLEIGAGTGWSFQHYPDAVSEIVALELDEGMLARAKTRAAAGSGPSVSFVRASAEALPFEDGSFDTTVAMVVLCTVLNPRRALEELRRVLRPGGQLLFVEHVLSADPRRARWQRRLARPWGLVARGCRPNRDTVATIEAAGFEVEVTERGELPMAPPIVKPFVLGSARLRTSRA